jgi:hypothetical protein
VHNLQAHFEVLSSSPTIKVVTRYPDVGLVTNSNNSHVDVGEVSEATGLHVLHDMVQDALPPDEQCEMNENSDATDVGKFCISSFIVLNLNNLVVVLPLCTLPVLFNSNATHVPVRWPLSNRSLHLP